MDEVKFGELIEAINHEKFEILDLSNQELNHEQVIQLAISISKNFTIMSVNFSGSRISEASQKLIEDAIFESSRQFLIAWMLDKRIIEKKVRQEEEISHKIVQCYLVAADKGHALSQYNLAILYLLGIYLEQSNDKAVEWCKKALDRLPSAQFLWGWMNLNGIGVVKNLESGKALILQSALAGNCLAATELARLYKDNSLQGFDQTIIYNCLEKAAETNAEVALQLAIVFAYSKQKSQIKKMLIWLQKAVQHKHSDAYKLVGDICYNHASCLPDNFTYNLRNNLPISNETIKDKLNNLALIHYRIAAKMGNPDAQYAIYNMYKIAKRACLNLSTDKDHDFEISELFSDHFFSEKPEQIYWGLEAVKQGHNSALKAMIKDHFNEDELMKLFDLGQSQRNQNQSFKATPNFETMPNMVPRDLLVAAINDNNYEDFKLWIRVPIFEADQFGGFALFTALMHRNIEFAKSIILHHKVALYYTEIPGLYLFRIALFFAPEVADCMVDLPDFDIRKDYPLIRAARTGHSQIVKKLLRKPGIDINAIVQNESITALWTAARYGHEEVVKLLLNEGNILTPYRCHKLSKQEVNDSKGKSSLDEEEVATIYGHKKVVRLIKNYKDALALKRSTLIQMERKTQSELAVVANAIKSPKETQVGSQFVHQQPERETKNNAEIIHSLEERIKRLELQNRSIIEKFKTQQRQNEVLNNNLKSLTTLFNQFMKQKTQNFSNEEDNSTPLNPFFPSRNPVDLGKTERKMRLDQPQFSAQKDDRKYNSSPFSVRQNSSSLSNVSSTAIQDSEYSQVTLNFDVGNVQSNAIPTDNTSQKPTNNENTTLSNT